jgi:pimeloyl-ACP methyl ester carboxylesterase
LQAADIVAVLQDLNISCANYWGYSMGRQIGFAMAQYAPDRVRGLVIGGAAGAGLSRASDRLLATLEARGVEAIPGIWGVALPPTLQARLLANDIEALKACRADSPGFAAILSAIAKPCYCTPVRLIQAAQQPRLPLPRCQMLASSQYQISDMRT